MPKENKIMVLFLCTGNSCRSQMAQGWANALRSDDMIAFSAGTNPCKVSQRAMQVMGEAGVDISTHYSKHLDELPGLDFDYVITLCSNAKENCPIFPGKAKVIHHGFEDPAAIIGTTDQVLNEFRRIRDEIKEFIINMNYVEDY